MFERDLFYLYCFHATVTAYFRLNLDGKMLLKIISHLVGVNLIVPPRSVQYVRYLPELMSHILLPSTLVLVLMFLV